MLDNDVLVAPRTTAATSVPSDLPDDHRERGLQVALLGWHDKAPVRAFARVGIDLTCYVEQRHTAVIVVGTPAVAVPIVEKLRQDGENGPVLAMIDGDLVDALNAGADDAQPLKCEMAEVKARLEAIVRRVERVPELPTPTKIFDIVLREGFRLEGPKGEVPLSRARAAIMRLLVERAPEPVIRSRLVNAVLNEGRTRAETSLTVQILRLRECLRQVGSVSQIAACGRGAYHFVAAEKLSSGTTIGGR